MLDYLAVPRYQQTYCQGFTSQQDVVGGMDSGLVWNSKTYSHRERRRKGEEGKTKQRKKWKERIKKIINQRKGEEKGKEIKKGTKK